MRKIVEIGEGEGSFLDLLLDETLCAGTVYIPKQLARMAGGINSHLKSGKKYELLMRIAIQKPIRLKNIAKTDSFFIENHIVLEDDDQNTKLEYGWMTDCYLVSKYSGQLQQNNLFDAVVQSILQDAQLQGRYNETVEYLEKMLKKEQEYYYIDDITKPILIYKGDDICHNVLTVFAEQFGKALEHAGKQVIYFDMGKEPIGNVTRYMYQHFCAIIGIQSYMFSIKLENDIEYLHQYIYGPKYNFIFDHPIWLKQHLQHGLNDFFVLTLDSDYVTFVQDHFRLNAILFPPAGIAVDGTEKKIYDLTFVGTYNDYRSQLPVLRKMNRSMRFFANHLLRVMRKNTDLSSEEAFDRTVRERGIVLTETEYLELFYEMRRVFFCMIHYYRECVIQSIIDGGIKIDLFGDSWKESRFYDHPNVVCHPDITVEESITVWKRSKLSLNIMSWHKAGFTERMANIMLAGTVLVTDDTRYLHNQYDENDMLIFRLNKLEILPQQIMELLGDEEKQKVMAERGKEKTLRYHTWEKRAEEFLNLL